MSKHKQAIDILLKAKADVKALLTDPTDQHHALRIDSDLQKTINMLSLTTGNGGFTTESAKSHGPATTLFGEVIEKETATDARAVKPSQKDVADLKGKVEDAYKAFPKMETKDILSDIEDLVIRGVAKKVGMKVSADNPKEITSDFIDQVKDVISKAPADKK